MLRFVLWEDQWKRVKGLLPGKDSDPGRSAYDNRLFLEAILQILHGSATTTEAIR